MKKIFAVILTVVLLASIAAFCFAEHVHDYVPISGTCGPTNVDGYFWVQSCPNNHSRHFHVYLQYRYTTLYSCRTCHDRYTEESYYFVYHCPYGPLDQ